MRKKSGKRNKPIQNEKIVHWTEVNNLGNKPLQPRPEMLSEDGYLYERVGYNGTVIIKYDREYVKFWFNQKIQSVGLTHNELVSILMGFLPMEQLFLQPFDTNIPELGKCNFAEFFQFLSEETMKGRFWTITSNEDDRCLFIADNQKPEFWTIPPNEHIGKSFYDSWRDTLERYERLKNLLNTDKVAPSFEYEIYWFNDSFVHHQQSYYLIEGLWGTQCRASVSEGWEIIRPASTE